MAFLDSPSRAAGAGALASSVDMMGVCWGLTGVGVGLDGWVEELVAVVVAVVCWTAVD